VPTFSFGLWKNIQNIFHFSNISSDILCLQSVLVCGRIFKMYFVLVIFLPIFCAYILFWFVEEYSKYISF